MQRGAFYVLLPLVALATAGACAKGSVDFGGQGGSTASVGSGGQGGSGGDGGGILLPCGVDCSGIKVPDSCHEARCNETTKACEVVELDDGDACDDGLFCTAGDTCQGGVCKPGVKNTCAATAPTCHDVGCDESTKTCFFTPKSDYSLCTDPENLCLLSGQCQFGKCIGPQNDCLGAPVPDECHVAVCNPDNGKCEAQVGNEGLKCTDQADLCTVGKTCEAGACVGGKPKDCSGLSKGCNVGVCDVANGQCGTKPAGEGGACDDLDGCTTGETCTNGMCKNGAPVTVCKSADGCCPAGCTEANDDDCGCSLNLALAAKGTTNGGGSDGAGYGPKNLNDGVTETGCGKNGCGSCFTWISNDVAPTGAYLQYEWASLQTIGSIYVDSKTCVANCGSTGRTLFDASVQWWDGAAWQTAATVKNNDGDVKLSFVPKLKTTKLRLFDVTAAGCQQSSNTIVYEWGVWAGTSCGFANP